jgi:hypothetical protein
MPPIVAFRINSLQLPASDGRECAHGGHQQTDNDPYLGHEDPRHEVPPNARRAVVGNTWMQATIRFVQPNFDLVSVALSSAICE